MTLTARSTDLQAAGDVMKRATLQLDCRGVRFLVNFPSFWKIIIDMVRAGSGLELSYEILAPGTNLHEHASVVDIVEIANLPKAIGGEAVSVDEDGNEDETYTRGVGQPTLSEFLKRLE